MDIGGTDVRIATISFAAAGNPKIGDYKTHPTPGIQEEISSDDFFRTVARYLHPVLDRSRLLGCCFSFATAPKADKDATGKQLKVCGLSVFVMETVSEVPSEKESSARVHQLSCGKSARVNRTIFRIWTARPKSI